MQFQSFDEPYVQRLRDGDFRTQEHFAAYFSELIQLKLRARLHSPHEIEDVRQESFVRVLTMLRDGKIRQPDRLGPFVNSVCDRVLQEYYRKSQRDTPLEEEEEPQIPSKDKDPAQHAITNQERAKVHEILEQMTERDRRILREVLLEERDKDAVCQDFGIDREYLRVLLFRAKQAFKKLYLK